MKWAGNAPGMNATGLSAKGPALSTFIFEKSPGVFLTLSSLGSHTPVRGELPGVEHQNSDLDKAAVTAKMPGNRGGFEEPTHDGTQRKARRLDVAASLVRTPGDLAATVSTNTAGAPELPAITNSTRRVPGVTKSGTPKTEQPVPEVDLEVT